MQFLERNINIIWSITSSYIYSWYMSIFNVSACLQAIQRILKQFLNKNPLKMAWRQAEMLKVNIKNTC